MNRKEFVDFLNSLEKKYPVDKWTYDEIHVWPIIKLQIYFYYLNNFLEEGIVSKPKKKSIVNNFLDVFISLTNVILLLIKPRVKGNWVIATEGENYKTQYKGENVNKFYYPLKSSIKKEGYKLLKLNRSSPPQKNQAAIQNNTIYIAQYYSFFRLWNKLNLYISKPKICFPDYKQLITELEEVIPYKSPFQEGRENEFFFINIEKVLVYYDIQKIILNKYSPRFIFELCYYVPSNLSINLLAEHRKIPSIEIQHGSMGDSHLAYYGWSKFPKKGYKIFPTKIWCWDRPSYNLINSWAIKTHNLNVVIGGNTWLTYINNLELNEIKEFFIGKNIILYTMQRNFIEDYIYETIKLSSNKFTWMIRSHPSRLDVIDEIRRKAQQYGIENKIEIDKAQKFPLPAILKYSNLHLSEFSGSIIEAASLGTHSIILNQIGVDSYKDYIDEGLATAFLSKDSENLFEFIDNFDVDNFKSSNNLPNYKEIIKDILS